MTIENIEIHTKQDYVHIILTYETLGISKTAEVSKKLHDYLDNENKDMPQNIVFDLCSVKYIDSSGIGVIVSLLTKCKKQNRVAAIYTTNKELMRNIKISKIDLLFPLFLDFDQTIEFITNK